MIILITIESKLLAITGPSQITAFTIWSMLCRLTAGFNDPDIDAEFSGAADILFNIYFAIWPILLQLGIVQEVHPMPFSLTGLSRYSHQTTSVVAKCSTMFALKILNMAEFHAATG